MSKWQAQNMVIGGKRQTWVTFWGFALLSLLSLAALFTAYVNQLDQTLKSEAQTYLSELSNHESVILHNSVTENLSRLETIAAAVEGFDGWNTEACLRYLQGQAAQYGYRCIIAADKSGACVTTDGKRLTLLKDRYFQRTMGGKPTVSGAVTFDGEGDMIVYAVPLYQEGGVVGMLGAVYSLSALQQELRVESFGGMGYFSIVTAEGGSVLRGNPNEGWEYSNYFTFLEGARLEDGAGLDQIRADFALGEPGFLHYTVNGVGQYVSYIPLDFNNWYLLTVVGDQVVSSKSTIFVKGTVVMLVGTMLLFLVLWACLAVMQSRAKRKLERIAYEDDVTGGYSKAKLQQHMETVLAANPGRQYCLVYSNLVKFKLINDTYGHESGNRTLRHIYQCISRNLRPGEMASRIAADNYVVFMEYQTDEEILDRLRGMDQEVNRFNEALESKYHLIFLVGVYVIENHALDFTIMMDRANIARQSILYQGGTQTRYAFYDEQARNTMIAEKAIENKMADALQNGEFEVYLQPKCLLRTGEVVGAEALIRWNDPGQGMLPPYSFISLFERNGFIVQLDRFVFYQVCSTLRRWIDQGREPLPISVNLSKVQMGIPGFLRQFEAIRMRFRVPAHLIEFELTETMVFQNTSRLLQTIDEIHALGYTCSMDDFGSGFSSLNTLKDIPVDVLKMDRGFFTGMDDSRSRAVIRGILGMAQALRIATVAEGVENGEQMGFLRENGCDMMQSFLYARPMPVAEFERFAFGAPAPAGLGAE